MPMDEDHISRDEARKVVGRAFYGDAWISEFSKEDWDLQRNRGPQRQPDRPRLNFVPPWPDAENDRLTRTIGRWVLAKAQDQTVDEWLSLYGFDPTSEHFGRAEFDAAVAGPMGKAIAEERQRHLASVNGVEPPDDHPTTVSGGRRKGGAPPRFDWQSIEVEVHRLMTLRGDFAPTKHGWNAQARLEHAVLKFCGPDSEPASSTLRERLPAMIERWRTRQ
jgi:hypothetical protein